MNHTIQCQTNFKKSINLTKEQSNKIQVIRGLAIIAVVFIHNTPNGLAQVWCRPFVNFCVGIFLFLSGLLSSNNNWNPKKRISKVVIPYFVWTFIYVVISNISNSINAISIEYIKAIILANSAPVMYYIFVYCEFTLLIPLIDRLARSKYCYLGFFISPIEIIFMRYFPLYINFEFNKIIQYMLRVSCLAWFTYFFLGYVIGNRIIKVDYPHKKLVVLWSASIILQIFEGYLQFFAGSANCGTQLKITSILSGCFFALLAYQYIIDINDHRSSEILIILGNDSFGIYFCHIAIMKILNRLPHYSQFILFPLNAIVTIIFSYLCVEFGKKCLGIYSKYLAL